MAASGICGSLIIEASNRKKVVKLEKGKKKIECESFAAKNAAELEKGKKKIECERAAEKNEMNSSKKPRVAVDANMLMAIGQFKVDVFSEIGKMFGKNVVLAAPMQVFDEVLSLSEGGKGTKMAAGIALQEMQNHKVKIVSVNAKGADNALVKMAKEGYIVASNDALLRKRIKGFAAQVIYLRQKRFLEIG